MWKEHRNTIAGTKPSLLVPLYPRPVSSILIFLLPFPSVLALLPIVSHICPIMSACHFSSRVFAFGLYHGFLIMTYRNLPIDKNTAMILVKKHRKKRRTTKPAYTIGDKTVTLKRPSGAIIAHAWAQGGSHHKPMRAQPLGCHPKEFKTKWTTKKGMGTPIA